MTLTLTHKCDNGRDIMYHESKMKHYRWWDASQRNNRPFLCDWRHLANAIKRAELAVNCCCALHTFHCIAMSVCVCICPHQYVRCSKTICSNSTKSPEHVSRGRGSNPARSPSYGSEIHTSGFVHEICFHTMESIGQNQARRYFAEYARWRHRGEVCRLRQHLVLLNLLNIQLLYITCPMTLPA